MPGLRKGDSSHWHAGYVRAAQLGAYILRSEFNPSKPMISAGSASVPALGLGASTVVPVSLRAGMGTVDFQAISVLSGTQQLLGALEVTATAIVSAALVNVTVRNTGLLTLAGATALVIALRD